MKLRVVLSITSMALVAGACGSTDTSTTNTSTPAVAAATTTSQPEETAEPSTTTEPLDTAMNGDSSLDDPIPVGAVVEAGDWLVRVTAVTADATGAVMAESDFNDAPGDGEQFFLAGLEATYIGTTSSTFWFDTSLKAVGDSKVAYESYDSYCGAIPDPIDDAGEVFPGGTITGNTCWKINTADADSLVMIIEDAMSFAGDRSYLLLDPTATPLDESTARAGAGVDTSDAIPVGAVGKIGDWSIRVVSVIADATEFVMTENTFNDPPEDGEQFFVAEIEATYAGTASSTFWIDTTLKAVGESSVAYESFDAYCGSIPNPIDDSGEAFPGGTITGNTCWKIRTIDADSLVMIGDDSSSFDESRTYFTLDPDATPISATTEIESDAVASLETVAMGDVAEVGDWSIRVVSVTPDASGDVTAESEFNDPPGDGEQFFMVSLEATYTGVDSSTFWADMTLKTVAISSVAYESSDSYCGSIPDPIDDAGETFTGGTITGNDCWRIDLSDADSLILIAEEWSTFGETRSFFSLSQ